MKDIGKAAALAGVAMVIGLALGVMGFGFHGDSDRSAAGTDPTTIVMLFGFAVWIITTLMIGQAMPRRPKPATISGMARKARVTITPELRNRIIAAYIGDGLPSIRDVARLTSCSYGTVHKIVAEAGQMRPRGITRTAQRSQAKVATS